MTASSTYRWSSASCRPHHPFWAAIGPRHHRPSLPRISDVRITTITKWPLPSTPSWRSRHHKWAVRMAAAWYRRPLRAHCLPTFSRSYSPGRGATAGWVVPLSSAQGADLTDLLLLVHRTGSDSLALSPASADSAGRISGRPSPTTAWVHWSGGSIGYFPLLRQGGATLRCWRLWKPKSEASGTIWPKLKLAPTSMRRRPVYGLRPQMDYLTEKALLYQSDGF